jgi:two-component system sensor histidine kinase PilS (NtrC family)
MADRLLDDISVSSRIRLLMLFRLAIVTFLLGVVVFMDIKAWAYVSEISIPFLYGILLFSYLLALLYLLFFRLVADVRINIYLQTFLDILTITALVYATGGIRSVYTAFYPLVIIYSVLFLGKNGGLISASGCSIFYGLLIDFEYLGVIPPVGSAISHDTSLGTGYVFLRIMIHIFSFYVIAALASYVVEREKEVRVLLLEKESAFNRLDRLYQSIVESIDAGILTIDLEGRIKSFNRGAEEITGYSFAEVENHDFHKIFPAGRTVFEELKRHNSEEVHVARVEVPFQSKDSRRLTLGCSTSSLRDVGGEKIGDIIVFQNLTRIKQMEEAVEKSRRLAFIGEMAASLAHELRNPLASISGSIQMLKRDLSLRVSDERLMQIIIRGKDQLEGFIKDFLLLARQRPLQYEEIDLHLLINEVIDSLRLVQDWHEGIQCETRLSGPAILYASKAEMRQLILNLFLNAIQAMPEGGRLVIETKTYRQGNGDVLELKVSDSGVGIGEESMKKIFEPFYTTKEKGTGLGLAIVNRIAEASSGEISVNSVPYVGTTFTVRLPVTSGEEMKG